MTSPDYPRTFRDYFWLTKRLADVGPGWWRAIKRVVKFWWTGAVLVLALSGCSHSRQTLRSRQICRDILCGDDSRCLKECVRLLPYECGDPATYKLESTATGEFQCVPR